MQLKEKVDSFAVSLDELDIRLDKLLTHRFPEHSRSYFQFLIDEELVILNGKPVKKQQKLRQGDRVQIHFAMFPDLEVLPEDIPLEILYEDEDLIAVNKPDGMVVHPAPGSPNQTFANALLYHCKKIVKEDFQPLRPGIVHRLDKDTTGVLLGAKTLQAHQNLLEQFAERKIDKTYLAICCGVPKEGEYCAPIKRHPIDRKKMTVSQEGKPAVTHLKVLSRRRGLSLVQAKLITGRTHQIRVHLKSMNCPILGDPVYGCIALNNQYLTQRQMLHAHQIQLTHPTKGTALHLTAPLHSDMKNFIELIQQP